MSTKPESYNAGDEDHVAARQQGAKEREAVRRDGLRKLMSEPACRLWLYDVLQACGIFHTSFTGNSETFMREGQRNIGLMIMADIHRGHEREYAQMCVEARTLGARGFAPKSKTLRNPDEGREESHAE